MKLSFFSLALLGAAVACQGPEAHEGESLASADSAASSAEAPKSRTVTLAVSGMT